MSKRILPVLLLLLILLFLPAAAYSTEEPVPPDDFYDQPDYTVEIVRGLVVAVEEMEIPPEKTFVVREQKARIEILSGDLKGKMVEVENALMGHPLYDIELVVGQQLYFLAEFSGGEFLALNISDHIRDRYIYWLAALFVVLMLIIGRMQGLKTLFTLILTVVLIFKFFIPLLTRGVNPVLLAIPLAVCVTIFTLAVIGGINSKSFAAILGTIGGTLVAGFLAFFVGEVAQLTGFSSEEAIMLQYAEAGVINIRGILFAGILIGSLGAIMDVAMSISSACMEMTKVNGSISRKRLFQAGMNVGRDIMGTMSNTLILAYTGSTIPLILLFYIYEIPMLRIINMDLIATEIVRALAGTTGLLVAIPLTALLAGLFMGKTVDS